MTSDPRGLTFQFPSDTLRPLIEAIVDAALARLDADRSAFGVKEVYSEVEAAQMLGLNVWSLRDERKRGRIVGSQICGRRIRYLRSDLIAYLMRNRTDKLT
jgi:hypothetical protein